jgi:hypothetical protein
VVPDLLEEEDVGVELLQDRRGAGQVEPRVGADAAVDVVGRDADTRWPVHPAFRLHGCGT